jgi:ribosomal protein L11 methyltransferase
MSTQDWLEISVRVDGEAAEAVSQVFHRYGQGGAVVELLLSNGLGAHDDVNEMVVKTYIPTDDTAIKRKIEEALWHLGRLYPIPAPRFCILTERDWAETWKAHYSILHIGRRTVIVPQWHSYIPQLGEVVITLDPGMAFGTGTHPTTRLCLAALEEVIVPGMSVLDLGTGSGVLAIAAAKQGASSVQAVDLDQVAVSIARENVATNHVANVVQVQVGSLDSVETKYDLIMVNILAEVICKLLDQGLADMLGPGGMVIASGIIDDQEQQVRTALIHKRIDIIARYAEQDWIVLIGRMPRS